MVVARPRTALTRGRLQAGALLPVKVQLPVRPVLSLLVPLRLELANSKTDRGAVGVVHEPLSLSQPIWRG